MGTTDRRTVGTPRWLLWQVFRAIWPVLAAILFRPTVRGTSTLPDGGYLLLANHTSTFDTLWVAFPTGRVVHFMTSADLFRRRWAAALLRAVNCFPKAVFVRDQDAMAEVERLLAAGQVVQIMPEGVRTWDGRTMPVGEGIGRLVRRLDATVVVCRVETGHVWWPRWARWPRWVPVRLVYDVPRRWPADAAPEAITADIVAAMAIPREPDLTGTRHAGFRAAEGLEHYLYACPACAALRTLVATSSVLSCTACNASWRVGVDNRLAPQAAGAPAIAVSEAYDRARASLGDPPAADRARLDRDGVVLDGSGAVLALRRGAAPEPVARGTLTLRADGLTCGGWALALADVVAVNTDAGNVLHLRTRAAVFRLVPDDGRTALWENVLLPWWRAAQPRAPG